MKEIVLNTQMLERYRDAWQFVSFEDANRRKGTMHLGLRVQ